MKIYFLITQEILFVNLFLTHKRKKHIVSPLLEVLCKLKIFFIMDTYKRKKLLENLWYVDENLKLTDDPVKSVGFIDLVLGQGTYYFIITFFEHIGVAKSSIEARNLIDRWLKNKFSSHRLVMRKSTFEPIIPLETSVALCNENFSKHRRKMEHCWVLEPFERKVHIDDINYRIDTALPVEYTGRFKENDIGAINCRYRFLYDVNETFNVFPAVLIDYNEFPVHCQNLDLMDCSHYSNTHSLNCYNEGIIREDFFKQRTSPVATINYDFGTFDPLQDDFYGEY